MTILNALEKLTGSWQCANKLWLDPGKPAHESGSSASVACAAQGQFITIRYTWLYDGIPQDGLIVLGVETKPNLVKVAWINSWHMADKMMICTGKVELDGTAWAKGTYAVPPGPDWGWRIAIDPGMNDTFQLVMHNSTPDGVEMLAVEASYLRQ